MREDEMAQAIELAEYEHTQWRAIRPQAQADGFSHCQDCGEDIPQARRAIKGKLDLVINNQNETKEQISQLDGRLRKVERKSALNGAISGGLVSVGVALMIEKGKHLIGL